MEYAVQVGARARRDVAQIAAWIAIDSPEESIRWLVGFWKAASSLRSFPARCRLAPESDPSAREIRQMLFGDYRILFAIDGDEVLILNVRHGAQRSLGPDEGSRGRGRTD